MTDPDPHLNTTEVRQGNSRKMNTRALIFGTIAIVILLGAAIWYFTATYDDTATTVGGGTTLEDVGATPGDADDLDALSMPAPVEDEAAPEADAVTPGVEEVAPLDDAPAAEDEAAPVPDEPAADADPDSPPVNTETPAAP